MDNDMVKVYEEEIFDDSDISSIWLNDVLEEENIIFENKIVKIEDSLFVLNFMTHKIVEVYVPKFYEEKVLHIIDEYSKKLEEEEIQDIPELADYSNQKTLPDDIKNLLDTYNNSILKSKSVKDDIIRQCVSLYLKEYNCKIDFLNQAKFEESLISKPLYGKYDEYLGEGYSAIFNIGNEICEIYTISLDKNDYKNSINIFVGTYIHFNLNKSYELSFCYDDEFYKTRLDKDFIESISNILKKYDYTITFSLQKDSLDFLISNYYIVDTNNIDEESLSQKAMEFRINVLIDLITDIRKLIEKYIW